MIGAFQCITDFGSGRGKDLLPGGFDNTSADDDHIRIEERDQVGDSPDLPCESARLFPTANPRPLSPSIPAYRSDMPHRREPSSHAPLPQPNRGRGTAHPSAPIPSRSQSPTSTPKPIRSRHLLRVGSPPRRRSWHRFRHSPVDREVSPARGRLRYRSHRCGVPISDVQPHGRPDRPRPPPPRHLCPGL
jgi:hypothetical protein